MNDELIDCLSQHCVHKTFEKGQPILFQGAFARAMYFILKGEVNIDLHPGDPDKSAIKIGQYSPLGEIGFFTGKSATANANAQTDVEALVIDDDALQKMEKAAPEIAVEFLRYLAKTMDTRLLQNQFLTGIEDTVPAEKLEVVRCINEEQLHQAQHLRYAVYCTELGRTSQYADDKKQTICDALDEHGISFLAMHGTKPVGTARVNLSSDGDLGILENLYGMANSPYHRDATCIITKFAILDHSRNGAAYAELLSATVSYIFDCGVREVFMDAIPQIAQFYKLMGFKQCEAEFIHMENGLSVPLKILDTQFMSKRAMRVRKKIFSNMEKMPQLYSAVENDG